MYPTYIYSAHNVSECLLAHAYVVSSLGNYKKKSVAREMAQRVKAIATKADGLSSIPGIHKVEGKKWLLQVVLRPLARTYTNTYTQLYTCTDKYM